MDCNSIVYDAVRVCPPIMHGKVQEFESELIQIVCRKIEEYIHLINPSEKVIIAFDGVAPVAKLNQQRERRYKSWFTSMIEKRFQSLQDKVHNTNHNSSKTNVTEWNTSSITPGTEFMKKLNSTIHTHFSAIAMAATYKGANTDTNADADTDTNSKTKTNTAAGPGTNKTTDNIIPCQIILSTSDKYGEGEHKIYEFIRMNPEYHRDTTTVIYGLDADLIMLTLNHLHIAPNLYIYRDTPEFISSLDSELSTSENYFFDIPLFSKTLEEHMRITLDRPDEEPHELQQSQSQSQSQQQQPQPQPQPQQQQQQQQQQVHVSAVTDYIFMCFMLGNDFMPHFPSMNLRTNGMDILMNAYRACFVNTKEYLVKRVKNDCQIVWKNVYKFISTLAEEEYHNLIMEHKLRDKQSRGVMHRTYGSTVPPQRHQQQHQQHPQQQYTENEVVTSVSSADIIATDMKSLMAIPLIQRSMEQYINPFSKNWEYRYYNALFDVEMTDVWVKEICKNYLEGLEWTMKYYTTGCVDWRWSYRFAYAPLLKDLLKYTPKVETQMLVPKPKSPIKDIVQLCYVLPLASHHLLPSPILAKYLRLQCPHYYDENLEFKWAYCKYFWEAHTDLPYINISDLEKVVNTALEQSSHTSQAGPLPANKDVVSGYKKLKSLPIDIVPSRRKKM
jgi:5'-3' exonuclease